MTDRRRFLHLERRRPAGPGGAGPSGVSPERFGGVEQARAAPAGPAAPPTPLPRFEPAPEPTLELADPEARRPFTRCARCGRDNNAFEAACAGCGADLGSAAQQAFDARFWAERDAQAAAEAQAAAALAEGRARAEAEEAAARRALGEAMAQEIGDAERRRLDGLLGPDRSTWEATPLGLRLLRLLPDARWRWGVGGALAALCGGLVLWGAGHRAGPALPLGLGLSALLWLPWGYSGRYGRWRRWWW